MPAASQSDVAVGPDEDDDDREDDDDDDRSPDDDDSEELELDEDRLVDELLDALEMSPEESDESDRDDDDDDTDDSVPDDDELDCSSIVTSSGCEVNLHTTSPSGSAAVNL